MSNLLKIKFERSPTMAAFLDAKWTPDNSRELMQVVEDELSLRNFPNIWRYNQGKWAPLSADYQKWKEKNYPGAKKWELTGAAMTALKTPIVMSNTGGTMGAKSVKLSNSGTGLITAEYEYRAPVAGGFFHRVNALRPMWDLRDASRKRIEEKIYKYLARLVKKALK